MDCTATSLQHTHPALHSKLCDKPAHVQAGSISSSHVANLHLCAHMLHAEHVSRSSPLSDAVSIPSLLTSSDGGSWINALFTTTLSDLTPCFKWTGFDEALISFWCAAFSFCPLKCSNMLPLAPREHTQHRFPLSEISSLNAFSRRVSFGWDCHNPQNWSVQSFIIRSMYNRELAGIYVLTCLAGSTILILLVTGPLDDIIGP